MNKKIISLFMAGATVCSIYGCGNSSNVLKKNNKSVIANYEENAENTEDEVKGEASDTDQEKSFHIENPSWEYYNADNKDKAETKPLELVKKLEKSNDIIDQDEWFEKNHLTNPSEEFAHSKELEVERRNWKEKDRKLLLILKEKNIKLDFDDYKYADNYIQEDKQFIGQEINFALIKDNILYVSIGHNTYAKSCSHNAYIVAIDLNDMKILWKTEPLTCNSKNFIIVNDVIICGYGFTEEDDYLKQVDIKTGKVIDKIPLKTQADYIVLKGNDLYVRCYDTDYKFNIK